MTQQTLSAAALSGRYTELPKLAELLRLGVRPELTPTFYALADYANNRTGECWPQMQTLAKKLGKSVRTVQSHLHELQDFGLIEFVQRIRAGDGKYRGYVYRLMHTAIIGERRERKRAEQQERERQRVLEKGRKRRERLFKKSQSTGNGLPVREDKRTSTNQVDPPNPPNTDFKEGFEAWFGESPPPQNDEKKPNKTNKDFKEGYEWFFE